MPNLQLLPQPLQWFEGMALSPQHFQQNDLYWDTRLHHAQSHLNPHYWGVSELQLDMSAILTGTIRVQALQAIMPDGLVIQYPGADSGAPLELDVSDHPVIRNHKPLMVQLAVPIRYEGAASSGSVFQRYDPVTGTVEKDDNTGDGGIEVARLRARIKLEAGEELPPRFVALPLLKVQKDIAGHFSLTEYHPPLMRLSASAFLAEAGLQAQLQRLAVRIRAKARELLGATDETMPSVASAYQLQIVRQLVAGLPQFELVTGTACAHPFQCYLALANLIGHVAGVSSDPLPMLLQSYRHEDPAPAILQALRHVSGVIANLTAAYVAILFERPREGLFTCELPAAMPVARLIVEIKPSSGQSAQAAGDWLREASIGSAPVLPLLHQRRILGGRVQPLSSEQLASLGVQSGCFYEIANQTVQQREKVLDVIQKASVLHIQGAAGSTAPAAIVLYVVNEKGAGRG